MRNSIPLTKSPSEIKSSDHHPALFFIQDGISCDSVDVDSVTGIVIIFS